MGDHEAALWALNPNRTPWEVSATQTLSLRLGRRCEGGGGTAPLSDRDP